MGYGRARIETSLVIMRDRRARLFEPDRRGGDRCRRDRDPRRGERRPDAGDAASPRFLHWPHAAATDAMS